MLSMIEDHLQRMLSHLGGSRGSDTECYMVAALVRRNDVDGQVSMGIVVELSHTNYTHVEGGIGSPMQHQARHSIKSPHESIKCIRDIPTERINQCTEQWICMRTLYVWSRVYTVPNPAGWQDAL